MDIFSISILPYFASWVSKDIHSIAAETMFGLTFLSILVLYILTIYEIHKVNLNNSNLKKINFGEISRYVPIIICVLGIIITYTIWTPGAYVCCLISIAIWLYSLRKQRRIIESKERFEALIDAIIAIIITVIVLEIPMVVNGSWSSFFELKIEFLVYIISFAVCFIYWNYTINLLNIVNTINYKVIAIIAVMLFALSLIPYNTLFIWNNFDSLIPNLFYGLNFILAAILSTYCMKVLKDLHKENPQIQKALSYRATFIQIIIICSGMIIGYFLYPPLIIAFCLVSMFVSWFISFRGHS